MEAVTLFYPHESPHIQDVTGNQNARDIGIQLSGMFKTKSARPFLNYSAGVFNGNGINKFDNNQDKAIAGRLIVSPIKSLWLEVHIIMARQGGMVMILQIRTEIALDLSWNVNLT